MSAEHWFERCDEILGKIRATQGESIREAARLIADAAEAGCGVHFHDTGHCSREPIHRAGGLCMLSPLQFSLNLESRAAPKRSPKVGERQQRTRGASDEQLAALAIERSALAAADVLIISSVSGKTASVVEAALATKRLGAKVVAITNVMYSRAVDSQHSRGKRLYEVADVVIDNCGVVGDAVLDVEGVGTAVAPTSGVTFCYIVWAIMAEAISQIQARGLAPHVYRSVNLPDGEEFNTRAEAAYRETGV